MFTGIYGSLFHILCLNMDTNSISPTKLWIIKVKHPSLDIHRKNISLLKINNILLALRTCIILLSLFVIYFFCICHSESFPTVKGNTLKTLAIDM